MAGHSEFMRNTSARMERDGVGWWRGAAQGVCGGLAEEVEFPWKLNSCFVSKSTLISMSNKQGIVSEAHQGAPFHSLGLFCTLSLFPFPSLYVWYKLG